MNKILFARPDDEQEDVIEETTEDESEKTD